MATMFDDASPSETQGTYAESMECTAVAKLCSDVLEVLHAAFSAEPTPSDTMIRVLADGLRVHDTNLIVEWFRVRRAAFAAASSG
ncbi:hypothetical protein KFE25_007871 [Diacronema lutheri]|uniref:Uncharacterized protein n=1 Tax=Diacronema lutheri TaxID=2081491 RepID=A0A8J5XK32_DIALT|nr:hypothetical protein KFE25_007871 [Diacronema lutheri]